MKTKYLWIAVLSGDVLTTPVSNLVNGALFRTDRQTENS
jgi:hypothetical protein